MGPIARKGVTAVTTGARQVAASEAQKAVPSKFDALRADLNDKLAASSQVPPPVTMVSDQQRKVLENDLRRKLQTATTPQELFNGDMKQLRSGIADLNRQVAAIPDHSAFGPLQDRLKSIETDFKATARFLKATASVDNPNRLLQMQVEVYKLAHNVEIMSRTLNEITSGVKTILQTQV